MEKASIYYLEFNLICVFILVRPLNRMPLLVLDVSGLGHCHIELHVLELEGSALLDSLSHHVGGEFLAHEGLHVALLPLNASQVLKELSIGQSDAVVELTHVESRTADVHSSSHSDKLTTNIVQSPNQGRLSWELLPLPRYMGPQ